MNKIALMRHFSPFGILIFLKQQQEYEVGEQAL